jgi:hypothetical protein
MKLDDYILQFVKKDECILGEALLEYAFVGEGRGCYSNFKLRDSFVPFPDGVDKYAPMLLGEHLYIEECSDEERESINSFIDSKTNIKIAWLWDGDGHLIFEGDDFFIENTDIKKSSRWHKCNKK